MKVSIKALLGDKYKEGMSIAEIDAVLADVDLHDDTDTAAIEKLKTTVSNSNADAKKWKDKYNETLSEVDRKKQEEDESRAALEAKVAQLEKAKTVSEHKAQYIALGYEETLAAETAEALADGNMDVVFANAKKANDAMLAKKTAELLKNTPTPGGGNGEGSGVMTKDKFRQLSLAEKQILSVSDPTTYKKMTE
jgi:hypothetical protein